MKYLKLIVLASIILYAGCQEDTADDITPDDTPVYIQDNIFGCDQFEVMETSATFPVNVEPFLEVFKDLFVYEDRDGLVIRDGFNGPTLQTYEMQVDGMELFNDQLMVCAEEGLFSLNAAGELDTITEQRCYSMALDGQGRLMLQGVFGNPGLSTAYDIYEFKNNTIVPFTALPDFFQCISVKLEGGIEDWLYAISCDHEIVAYDNGVIKAELDNGLAPLFAPLGDWFLYQYYEGGLIAITLDISRGFRMYKLVGQQWLPLYDLEGEEPGTDKFYEVLLYVDHNLLVHDGFLYTFGSNGSSEQRPAIARFDVSDDEEKGWDDIELIQIPGLNSREIVDIVVASDGSAYAVLRTKQIVKLTCD